MIIALRTKKGQKIINPAETAEFCTSTIHKTAI